MPRSELQRGAWALAAVASFCPIDAMAQAPPFMCGPDCSRPGRYVLCADDFDSSGTSPGGVVLQNFLEAACVSFTPPAAELRVTGFAALFGPGDVVATLLEIFIENGTAAPGMRLIDTGVGIPAAPAAGFTGLFFSSTTVTTDFRLCLRQQIDDSGGNATGRPLLFDDDGVQGTNTVFRPGPAWEASTAPGDFILRPVVEYDDLTPWAPGGPCDRPDGGVAADSGMVGDAGATPVDTGAPAETDAGDEGPGSDAGPDAGGDDAMDAGTDPGGGDAGTGTGNGGPPTITAISPKEGSNLAAVDVTVIGTNFAPGAILMIGTIQANDVSVPGSTTILGQIPASITPGVYDVIVRNPDEQTALLSDGYTVRGAGGGAPPAAGCGCRATGSTPSALLLWLVLGLLCLRIRVE